MNTYFPFLLAGRAAIFRVLLWIAMLTGCMAVARAAEISDGFESYNGTGYISSNVGPWALELTMVDTDSSKAHTGSKSARLKNAAGACLTYRGENGTGKANGLGVVSIWYRHWDGDGSAASFVVECSSDSGDTWVQIGDEVAVSSTTYSEFSDDAGIRGDGLLLRIRATATAERICLDDITLGDCTGPAEDPNLRVTPTLLAFGTVATGSSATQTLTVANSGATKNLRITSLSAVSDDTNQFRFLDTPPATLAPGANVALRAVYTPGATAGVAHRAVWQLVCDDPSTPTNAISLNGQTPGAALSVSNVQYSTASGGASPLAGQRVTVGGIATYADPNGYAISDANGGAWSGVYVADLFHRPEAGDRVILDATVQENGTMTQLSSVSNYITLSTGNALPPASVIPAAQLAQEKWEGVRVAISSATVTNVNVDSKGTCWQGKDAAGTSFRVLSRVPLRYCWTNGERFDAIQGIVYTNAVSPRGDADLIGRRMMEYALGGTVITPEGPLSNGWVHVRDDLIVSIGTARPAVTPAIDTGGILFPGLIDAHNHAGYNSLPTLMFNNFPFGHRDAWGEDDAEYSDWKAKRNSLRTAIEDPKKDLVSKYGECLELMAGCTVIQGQSNSDIEHCYPPVILRNIEMFPSRVSQDIFPWDSTASERSTWQAKIAGGAINALMIHLSEGTDTVARAQFSTWKNWGMLNRATTIIHGAALHASDFTDMAAAGARLVWSPMSNMKLYAGTVDLRAAVNAGVLVGLSPDWTPSGCFNLLEELGYAWELVQTRFDGCRTPRQMCEMVTLNTAICSGIEATHGTLEVGKNAGIVVIDSTLDPDPYLSLIRARPAQVKLTVVDGVPRYGDTALMSALGLTAVDDITLKGRAKRFNIAVNHPYLEYGNMTFNQISTAIAAGHDTLTPTGELDREELQFLSLHLLQNDGDDVAPFRADSPLSTAPSATVMNDTGSGLTLTFRYQDFWDNATFVTDLVHTIDIVPAAYPQYSVQTIAVDRPNTRANQTVPFTIAFGDMHTNYLFRFTTRDAAGNERIATTTNGFKVKYHAGGDTDGDGIPNEWAIEYYGAFNAATPTADTDHDDFDTLAEYIADTDPTDAASNFGAIEMISAPSAGTPLALNLTSATSTGRVYDLAWTESLLDPVWIPLGLNRRGTGAPLTLEAPTTSTGRFYRATVALP